VIEFKDCQRKAKLGIIMELIDWLSREASNTINANQYIILNRAKR
jgi:hypothetical protein